MPILSVNLPHKVYPIYIGSGVAMDAARWTDVLTDKRAVIITNETVAPLYLDKIRNMLGGITLGHFIIPDGEIWKNSATLNRIFDYLIEQKWDRSTTLIALGGGVVGDITGFAAACYQRGVPFIQVPTTLLAQVDSSVGGKTGINHPLAKNMIGAFYQPECVFADTDFLQTLPEREYRAGLAEVFKYGLINDVDFYRWMHDNLPAIMQRDSDCLIKIVYESCKNKAAIVGQDERDYGQRALLNFGHTFGHAIEAIQEYKVFLHGEAVALGMSIAAELSCTLGYLKPSEVQEIRDVLEYMGLPIRIPSEIQAQAILEACTRDKKVVGGKIRFIILGAIGCAQIKSDIEHETVAQILHKSGAA